MWKCTTIYRHTEWKHILNSAETYAAEQSSGFSLVLKIIHTSFQLNIISFGIMFSTNKQQKRLQTALSSAWARQFTKADSLRDFKKQRRCLSLGHKVFFWSASLRCLAAMSVFSALVTRSWGNSNSGENNDDPRWDEDVWSGTGWEVQECRGGEPQVVCWGLWAMLLWSAHTLGSQHTQGLVHIQKRACTHVRTHMHTHKHAHTIPCKFKERREDQNNPGSLSIYRAEIRRGGLK